MLDSTLAKNGTIKSPLFPITYPPRTFCRYEFRGRGKERIQVSIPPKLHIELDVNHRMLTFRYRSMSSICPLPATTSAQTPTHCRFVCSTIIPQPIYPANAWIRLIDSIQIYENYRGRLEVTEILCGDPMPKPIMSDTSRMTIEFRGMRSGMGSRGFKADYSFLESEYGD